ncbi:hypothetical protein VNO78_14694 [Psophocarpus tetragonolobus]|uniref:Bifunctional inhibitor/plant lipid transfer protein/seed storage helical domain-containing protein n=1 Tax=Psophocarpus tetragonolobus TaxID=3891 RepID=A0AAN9SCP6_PSOTE
MMMMMMRCVVVVAAALLVVVMVMVVEVGPMAEAVECVPAELSPCLAAINSNTKPSGACCQKLRQQKSCLCGYLKNPVLKPYITAPGARTVLSSCGLPYPSC